MKNRPSAQGVVSHGHNFRCRPWLVVAVGKWLVHLFWLIPQFLKEQNRKLPKSTWNSFSLLFFFSQVSIECVWLFHIHWCSAFECHYLKLVQKANILAWVEATDDVWVFCIGNDGSRAIIKWWPLTLINGLIVIYLTLVIGITVYVHL